MPFDGAGTRLLRTAVLADELTARGHDVTYFNASFNHQRKFQRCGNSQLIEKNVSDNIRYRTVLLYGRRYKKNISVARFLSQRENAAEFERIAPSMQLPHVIIAGYPPVELANAAVRFANANEIPIAVDCRDMWPDIIGERLPLAVRVLAAPMLQAMKRMKHTTLAGATAITGITDRFVDWGVIGAGRVRSSNDRAFHLAVSPARPSTDLVNDGHRFWAKVLDSSARNCLLGCFAGTLASRLDLNSVIDGLDLLDKEERGKIRIILCGKGDLEVKIKMRAKRNPALIFGGWRNAGDLAALMEICAFGILPYPNSTDFLASFPNKVGEYLLAGLPIMTGLKGVTGELLEANSLKIGYQQGSPASFAQALRGLLNDNSLQNNAGNARRVGSHYFNPSHIYPAFADWTELLAKKLDMYDI